MRRRSARGIHRMLSALSFIALPIYVNAQTPGSGTPVASAAMCPAGRAPLMIVGTYHMANPGKDAVNLEADDVLSARRQAEIIDVAKRLASFAPTRVAVEYPVYDPQTQRRYQDYLAGRYALTRNEVDQIGFRVAQLAGLSEIRPIDFPMYMSGLTPNEIDDTPQRPSAATPVSTVTASTPPRAEPARQLSPDEQLLRQATVAQFLAHMNDTATVSRDAEGYPKMLLPDTSTVAIYAGADRVTNWYKRNLRMFANLNRGVDFSKDRVLLLVGAGHIHILSDLALTSPYYCLVSPQLYLTGRQ